MRSRPTWTCPGAVLHLSAPVDDVRLPNQLFLRFGEVVLTAKFALVEVDVAALVVTKLDATTFAKPGRPEIELRRPRARIKGEKLSRWTS